MDELARFELHITLTPHPRMCGVVRRFVEETLERLFIDDPDTAFRVSMTAHELLENAAKYSIDRRAELEITVEKTFSTAAVKIMLSNDAAPPHVARVRAALARLSAAPDMAAHYQTLMLENVSRSDESGLGLARIVAEGGMNLAAESSHERVTLIASGSFVRPPDP